MKLPTQKKLWVSQISDVLCVDLPGLRPLANYVPLTVCVISAVCNFVVCWSQGGFPSCSRHREVISSWRGKQSPSNILGVLFLFKWQNLIKQNALMFVLIAGILSCPTQESQIQQWSILQSTTNPFYSLSFKFTQFTLTSAVTLTGLHKWPSCFVRTSRAARLRQKLPTKPCISSSYRTTYCSYRYLTIYRHRSWQNEVSFP